jgi:hypothetical protein
MRNGGWKFYVQGAFHQDGKPVLPCEAIVDSGDRTEGSPFRLRGVGPVAKADDGGRFRSWYLIEGSDQAIRKPETVSVYVRVAKGCWEPIVVPIGQDAATSLSDAEMQLDLGAVALPSAMSPYAQDA